MQKQELHYFLETLGSSGFVDYYSSSFSALSVGKTFYAYPLSVIGTWVSELKREAQKRELACEIIHHFLDDKPLGIIIPSLSAGFYCVPFYRLGNHHYETLADKKETAQIHTALAEADAAFQKAKKIHDDWEKIYVSQMDFGAADSLADEITVRLLSGKHQNEAGIICDRFLGAATSEGAVDKIESISAAMTKRYFIKGRPGTGKSTLLRRVVSAATAAGFRVERYHCSFDPKSLDMVVIRSLGICLFDSTAPHEHFPSRSGDEIVDIYEAAVTPGTDEKFEKELSHIATEYKFKMLEAKKALAHARTAFDRIEVSRSSIADEATLSDAKNQLFAAFSFDSLK